MMRFIFLIIVNNLVTAFGGFAQERVVGYVFDSVTKTPIAYAAVGVVGGFQGTATNQDGAFDFVFYDVDSIDVSSIGYHSQTVPHNFLADTIWLKPTTTILNEITILSKDINAAKIVKKALRSVKKNFIVSPFVSKTFYRHYCKDSTQYTRLVEAAFDQYRPKGYKKPLIEGVVFEGLLKLQEVRRVINVYDNGLHPANAIQSCLVEDVASGRGLVYPLYMETNITTLPLMSLQHFSEGYSFDLDQIDAIDNQKVYVISFSKILYQNEYNDFVHNHTGRLFITSDEHVIIRYESVVSHNGSNFNFMTGTTQVSYKKYGERYALSSIIKKRQMGKEHEDVMKILVNEVIPGKSDVRYKQKITREDMAFAPYNPEFWTTYNVIRQNNLDEKIITHLQASKAIFFEAQRKERQMIDEEKKDLVTYDSLLKNNKGLMCVVYWKASGRFSLKQDYNRAIEHIEQYKSMGINFVFVSMDYNRDLWKDYIKNHIRNEWHLRIGDQYDQKKYHIRSTINFPQYLIYHDSELVTSHAPKPYTEEFNQLIGDELVTR